MIGGAYLINASLFHTGGTLAAQIASQFQNSAGLQKASLAYLGLILLVFAVDRQRDRPAHRPAGQAQGRRPT